LGVDLSNVEQIGDNRANLLDDIRIEFGNLFQTQVNYFLLKNKLNKMMNVHKLICFAHDMLWYI